MNISDLPSMKTKCGVVVDDYYFDTYYWVVGAVGGWVNLGLNQDDMYVEFSPIIDTIEDIGWALSEEL